MNLICQYIIGALRSRRAPIAHCAPGAIAAYAVTIWMRDTVRVMG